MTQALRRDIIGKLAEYSEHYLEGILPWENYTHRYRELRLGYVLDYLMDIAEGELGDEERLSEVLRQVGRYAANDKSLPRSERIRYSAWFDETTLAFRDELKMKDIIIPPGLPETGRLSRRGALGLLALAPLLPFATATAGYFSAETIAPYFTDSRKLQGLSAIVAGGAALDLGVVGTVCAAQAMREVPPSLSSREWSVLYQQINAIIEKAERSQTTGAAI